MKLIIQIINMLPLVRPFLSKRQFQSIMNALSNDPGASILDDLLRMAPQIVSMPKADGKGLQSNNALVYLHYYSPIADWYITEQSSINFNGQALGYYRALPQEKFIFGQILIADIFKCRAQLDLSFTPRTIKSLGTNISTPLCDR